MYRSLCSFNLFNYYFVLLVLLIVSFIFLFVIFLVRPIIGLDIFMLNSSNSSSSGSEDPSSDSSSSSGDPKRDSFWKKYWKIILGSIIAISFFSSVVIYYYYNYKTGNTNEIAKNLSNVLPQVTEVVQSNTYYFTWSNTYIPYSQVVLTNPSVGQYAIFSTNWASIFQNRVSLSHYNFVMDTLGVRNVSDRLVFDTISFEDFVTSVGSFSRTE